MRKKTITITIAGECGSGKTTIMREVQIALAKAGIKDVKVDCIDGKDYWISKVVQNDLIQGKKLDMLAHRVRLKELEIKIQEVNLNRHHHEDDVPF
jgi:uridine kinase